MKRNVLLVLASSFFIFSFTKVKTTDKEKINWLTLDEVNVKMKNDPKPVIIDLYTSWCYWCKVMDKKTYSNEKVISYINEHFYPVKVNAETKNILVWDDKNYGYNPGFKVNDFAVYVTQGQLAFPNTVIFPEMKNPPAAIPGFMEPKEIEMVLKYFGDGFYKKQNFKEFSANFKATW